MASESAARSRLRASTVTSVAKAKRARSVFHWSQEDLAHSQGLTPSRRLAGHHADIARASLSKLEWLAMNPFNPFECGDGAGVVVPQARRWPHYSFHKTLDGRCEVVTSEPGGPQKATWTQGAPAMSNRPEIAPGPTVFEPGERKGPTEEFKALVADLRDRNDWVPKLRRKDDEPISL